VRNHRRTGENCHVYPTQGDPALAFVWPGLRYVALLKTIASLGPRRAAHPPDANGLGHLPAGAHIVGRQSFERDNLSGAEVPQMVEYMDKPTCRMCLRSRQAFIQRLAAFHSRAGVAIWQPNAIGF
jgi:hypothetical protein